MSDFIAHHGVKGQRWGVSKYYDKNGKLTELGKKHYAEESKKAEFKRQKALTEQEFKLNKRINDQRFKQQKSLSEQASQHESKRRRGRVLAAAALVAIGAAAAKGIMNNIRANKLKLADGQSRIKLREMLQEKKLKDHP